MRTTLLSILAIRLTDFAVAHGGLANYTVGDTWYRGYDPDEPLSSQEGQPWMVQRIWASIDPIFFVNDTGLACNVPGTAPPAYIPIAAGDILTAVYWYWLHPVGPMSVWLAECGETCEDVNVNQLDFFKIWEAGLLEGNVPEGIWYQKQFQNWDGSPDLWPVTIPATIRPGLYIVRHEILSIHIADKPQFYPECAHLNVTGSGTAVPPASFRARFPGAYAADDPSIKIDIYTDAMKNTTNYTIAGPPVWDGFVNKYCQGC
ncbi:glycoside hydrolase family 61 protein [Xylariaceae sp. FL1019]|nr:glycoside hydrolase family 61 protein [Xylariaceae sp. FL1019]